VIPESEGTWRKIWSEHEARSKPELERIKQEDQYYTLLKKLIKPPIGAFKHKEFVRLAEVGCGSGIRTIALLSEFNSVNWEVTFIDREQAALSLVKKTIGNLNTGLPDERVDYMKADMRSLPIGDNAYDIVWNEGVMEHFKGAERQSVFDELHRVCKQGGYYICIVPNKLNFTMFKNLYLKMSGNWRYGYQDEFTLWELKRRLKDAGFTVQAVEGIGVFSSIFFIPKLFFAGGRNVGNNTVHGNKRKKTLARFESATHLGRIAGKELGALALKEGK
jgi:ubiquinone/menaquinone biosynthesis C-methylase UbiE